jgi:hypothetical protein
MSDQVPITPGVGVQIATDDIAGVQYQRMKLIAGIDGTNDGDIAKTNPLPSRMGVSLTRDFLVATINVSASGANALIVASGVKVIRVLGWAFKVGGAVTVGFYDSATAGYLVPAMPYANNGDGWVMDIIGQPYLVTPPGGNLAIVLSAAIPVTGLMFYTQD